MKENVVAVLKTLPKATAATAVRGNSQRASSSGIGGILKLANLLLNAEANAMSSGGGGGYSGGGGVDFTQANMDFTQGLQDQTWSSVDSAASNWNAQ
jgi:hypothetical protein